MVLGMHPVFAYPRRSRVAPFVDERRAGGAVEARPRPALESSIPRIPRIL